MRQQVEIDLRAEANSAAMAAALAGFQHHASPDVVRGDDSSRPRRAQDAHLSL
jgi:hypothetical protein